MSYIELNTVHGYFVHGQISSKYMSDNMIVIVQDSDIFAMQLS